MTKLGQGVDVRAPYPIQCTLGCGDFFFSIFEHRNKNDSIDIPKP